MASASFLPSSAWSASTLTLAPLDGIVCTPRSFSPWSLNPATASGSLHRLFRLPRTSFLTFMTVWLHPLRTWRKVPSLSYKLRHCHFDAHSQSLPHQWIKTDGCLASLTICLLPPQHAILAQFTPMLHRGSEECANHVVLIVAQSSVATFKESPELEANCGPCKIIFLGTGSHAAHRFSVRLTLL